MRENLEYCVQVMESDLRYNLFCMEHGTAGLDEEPVSDPLVWGRAKSRHGYRCAKCRALLLYAAHVVPHSRERPVAWWADDPEIKNSKYLTSCSHGLFVILLPWMGSVGGRLRCAGCDSKLGSMRLKGEEAAEGGGRVSCPCGASTPAGVWINVKKVDKFQLPPPPDICERS